MSKEIRDGKTVWWLYQGRRVATMAAGGGAEAMYITIDMPAGTIGMLNSVYIAGTASAASTLTANLRDEDAAFDAYLGSIAAGASREMTLPSQGSNAVAHQNVMDSTDLLLGPGMQLRFQASASANAETLTVGISLLLSTPTAPTWAVGGGGTPTLAASTISAANTLQAVVL